MPRILTFGISGSGKTAMAAALADEPDETCHSHGAWHSSPLLPITRLP